MEAALQQIEKMRDKIAEQEHPRAKFELLTRTIAADVRSFVKRADYRGLASYAAHLDNRTPELWQAFSREKQEQAVGAKG